MTIILYIRGVGVSRNQVPSLMAALTSLVMLLSSSFAHMDCRNLVFRAAVAMVVVVCILSEHQGDVASDAWPCLMYCRFHTAFSCHSAYTLTILSTTLLPLSYFTGKPKCSHTCDLNDAGGFSSSSVPPLAID